MRNLEEANDLVLLERRPRGVVATDAGEVLAAHARAVFAQVQQLERDMLLRGGLAASPTVLLLNSSALARPVAQALVDLDGPEESRAVIVRESSSDATVQALRSGAADVGIVADMADTSGLATQDLGPDPLVLVVSPAHPLAGQAAAGFREALAEPWVSWGEHSALSAHLRMRALALGERIDARVSYPTLAGVLSLVARGLGVTVLPRTAVDRCAGGGEVAYVPLRETWAQRRLLVCHPEGEGLSRRRLAARIARLWEAR
jgi:DNA-binding transcriptional LysR family regulator